MKKNQSQIQQGDVLIALIPKLPAGAKRMKRDNRGVVLAEGERTGHYHGCADSGVALFEGPGGERFVVNEADEPRSFVHQEHMPVTLPAGGIGRVGGVLEKDWFTDMTRKVVD